MADPTTAPVRHVTRQQAIVLAVLGAALLAALLINPSSDNSQNNNAVSTAASARQRRSPEPTKSASWKPNWPKVSLDKMLHQNPFAAIDVTTAAPATNTPETVIAATPNENPPVDANSEPEDAAVAAQRRTSEETFAAFTSQKVKMTLRTGANVSALIGERLVHEGEIIDGIRIVSILPTGVLVEPVTTDLP